MNYEVIEKCTAASEVMSDAQIEQKFGPVGFTKMVTEVHSTHIAVAISDNMDDDDFLEMDNSDDDYRDILDALG